MSVLRLNPHIEFTPVEDGYWLVRGEGSRSYIRLNPVGYRFLQCFRDGKSLEEVAGELASDYGHPWKSADMFTIYRNLFQGKGLFIGDRPTTAVRPYPDYIWWGFTMIDQLWVEKIAARLTFLFDRKVLAVFGVLVLWELSFAVHHSWQDPQFSLYDLIIPGISVWFHELGHAAALILRGGRPGAIGGGMYLIFPVMFSDVTEAWKLDKSGRVMVNLAGIYFEAVFSCLLFSISYLAGFEMGMLGASIILLRSFWNLNPFIRSDGYWTLADLTSQHDLRRQAFKAVRMWWRGGGPGSSDTRVKWWMLIVYGLAFIAFHAALFATILFTAGEAVFTFPWDTFDLLWGVIQGRGLPGDLDGQVWVLSAILWGYLIRTLAGTNVICRFKRYLRTVLRSDKYRMKAILGKGDRRKSCKE